MTRLIDADALKKAFEDRRGTNIHYNDVIKLIDNAPTVTPKQGEWIHCLGCGVGKAVCSECGQVGETKKYCGNCGADMRKGGKE